MANGNEELHEALLETDAVLNGEALPRQSAFAAVAAEPDIPREKQPRRPRHVSRCSLAPRSWSLPLSDSAGPHFSRSRFRCLGGSAELAVAIV